MMFNFRIGFKDIKKYKKFAKKHTLQELIDKIESDYKKLDSDEKRFVEISLKDAVNDIDKMPLIGILVSLATGAINNTFYQDKIMAAIVILVIHIIIGIIFIFYIQYYRICKIYLEVIKSIR